MYSKFEVVSLISLGWISTFARLSIFASASFVVSQILQGVLILNIENYEPLRWHGTLLYWMVILFATLVNILGIRVFPHIETAAFLFHICFFFVLLVPLVYLTPQSSSGFVFADFENAGGWSSNGVSWCLGLLTSGWCFVGELYWPIRLHRPYYLLTLLGIDGTSHMSQKLHLPLAPGQMIG